MPKRRVLLVDDEVTLLLTLKAVLEISGFDVDTAASAREGKHKIKTREYQMVITDMRMESDASGREVIIAARTAPYHPAVALLTAYPLADEDWQEMGADKMLVKAMRTRELIQSIERLLAKHSTKLARLSSAAAAPATPPSDDPQKAAAKRKPSAGTKKSAAKKAPAKKAATATSSAKKSSASKSSANKPAAKKSR